MSGFGEFATRRDALSLMTLGVAAAIPTASSPIFATNVSATQSIANYLTLSQRIAAYLNSVRFSDLSADVVQRAKEHFIYHVGLAFQGAATETGKEALRIANVIGESLRPATIMGVPRRAGAPEAAFTNASFIRTTGFDDVLFPSATHAGLLVYPAALAIAEQQASSGAEFLTAVASGYEILGKMVTYEAPGRAPHRPSMPFGPFASATVAAMLMKLSSTQMANTIGYAADGAMGLKEGNEQQPTHVYGLIARTGIMAATLAKYGGQTAPTILEGKYGFFKTIIGNQPDSDRLIGSLGKEPEILNATQKRYPGTALNIVPIQLILDMVRSHGLNASNVRRMDIQLPADRATFEDSISKGPYPTDTQAESSLPFQTAIILLDGEIRPARYKGLADPVVLQQVAKIFIELVPALNTRFARIRITTNVGDQFNAEGSNYVFPPLDALAWVSRSGASFVPRSRLQTFVDLAHNLEHVRDMREVTSCLRPGV